jgi:hypothetical protein
MKSAKTVGFWILVVIVLTLSFGRQGNDFLNSFFFVTLLLPVIVATSFLLNQYLLPRYLLTKKYLKFILYSIYTVIISVYLEMLVLVLAFIYLANYEYAQMNPLTTDVFGLTITLYFVVLFRSMIVLLKHSFASQQEMSKLEAERSTRQRGYLLVRADRKTAKLLYEEISHLESMGDYVKIFTTTREPVITKEKISKLEQRLPSQFLRIHRSFIINTDRVQSYSKEAVKLEAGEIPISRSYKSTSLQVLAGEMNKKYQEQS